MTNKLFYGDNLDVLREHIADESVDLVYLDPPFNSNAGYNVLFKAASGASAEASIEAFDDTWTWGDSAKDALLDIASGTNRPLQVMMEAMRSAIGENPLMAYLAMMAVRLVELHRVLRPTGSLRPPRHFEDRLVGGQEVVQAAMNAVPRRIGSCCMNSPQQIGPADSFRPLIQGVGRFPVFLCD
jgi:hypothetical protein